MAASDSSYLYEITASDEERIENEFQQERHLHEQELKEQVEMIELERRMFYARIYDENFSPKEMETTLKGLTFCTFRHTKIKFSFTPSTISNLITHKYTFYVSLMYTENNWRIKRDSLPLNCKWEVYSLFYYKKFFAIDDDNIVRVIRKIYKILVLWTKENEQFRKDKFERFQNGEDVELDSEDEHIFLSQSERIHRYQKKLQMLKRMTPPEGGVQIRLI